MNTRAVTSAWFGILAVLCFSLSATAADDAYTAAVTHSGRPEADQKRDSTEHPADLLRLAGIKPGMRVLDFLAADGYYTELLSYIVGSKGQVVMLNNAEFDKFSEPGWQKRIEGNRLPNVEHRTVKVDAMNLPANSFDAIVVSKVYHDLYWVESDGSWPKIDTKAVLKQLASALKPGGTLLLVDHSAKAGTGSNDAGSLHRIEESFARKDFEANGFEVVKTSDLLRRPDDKRDQVSYKPPALGKTDRFVMVMRKKA